MAGNLCPIFIVRVTEFFSTSVGLSKILTTFRLLKTLFSIIHLAFSKLSGLFVLYFIEKTRGACRVWTLWQSVYYRSCTSICLFQLYSLCILHPKSFHYLLCYNHRPPTHVTPYLVANSPLKSRIIRQLVEKTASKNIIVTSWLACIVNRWYPQKLSNLARIEKQIQHLFHNSNQLLKIDKIPSKQMLGGKTIEDQHGIARNIRKFPNYPVEGQ